MVLTVSACAKLVPVAVLASLTTHVLVLLKRLDVPTTALSTTIFQPIQHFSHHIWSIVVSMCLTASIPFFLRMHRLLARPNKLFSIYAIKIQREPYKLDLYFSFIVKYFLFFFLQNLILRLLWRLSTRG